MTKFGSDFSRQIIRVFHEIKSNIDKMEILPSEGVERPFRDLLKTNLFKDKLGWPEDKIISGEIYDIYCRDDLGFVVVYVETKSPTRKMIPEMERNRFLEKLRSLGTADYGIMTDGKVWEQYECNYSPVGTIEIRKQAEIDLQKLINLPQGRLDRESSRLVYEVFSRLIAQRYLDRDIIELLEKGSGKLKFRSSPVERSVVKEFTSRLKKNVDNLNEIFATGFHSFYSGTIITGRDFFLEAFDDWNRVSGKVPWSVVKKHVLDTTEHLLELRAKKRISNGDLLRNSKRLTRDLGIRISEAFLSNIISDYVSKPSSNSEALEHLVELHILDVIKDDVNLFCRQTSHVLLSRLLLYRVCEDKHLVVRKLSGDQLARELKELASAPLMTPLRSEFFLRLTDEVSRSMREVYGHLYAHNIFDWWWLSEDNKTFLKNEEMPSLERFERLLSIGIKSALKDLAIFDLSGIDRDVWKDVYQDYLPPVERNRLGGFYTPDEVVSLILKLVGFNIDEDELCQKKLLDPACGSGTFLVEASRRLRDHLLNTGKPCHKELIEVPDHEKQRFCLEKVKENIYGVDIHPFACFLSEVNLLFQTIDLLLNIKQRNPNYRLGRFNVHNADSLRSTERLQLGLREFPANHRAKMFLDDIQQAEKVKKERFNYLVGNPPWGGVLRGRLSPLFDDKARQDYKRIYKSAQGKYDIYVLFMERGLLWVKKNGIMGLITQNRFKSQDYGKAIRRLIANNCKPLYIIDLGDVGSVIFEGVINYPCISVFEKVQ